MYFYHHARKINICFGFTIIIKKNHLDKDIRIETYMGSTTLISQARSFYTLYTGLYNRDLFADVK